MKIFSLFLLIVCGSVAFAIAGDASLQALFDEDWNFRLREDPLFATSAGAHDYDALLPFDTKEDFGRRNTVRLELLKKLKALNRSSFSRGEQISYELLKNDLQDSISEYEFQTYLIPLNADSGFHSEFARLPRQIPLGTVRDYENYIARLNAFPEYVRQNITLMREGLKTGMSLPAITLEGIEVTISSNIVEDPAKSVFYAPFSNFPSTVPASERDRLRNEGIKAIRESAVSGYREFLEFMTAEYLPKTRRTTAAYDLPNGRKYYEYLVRHFTTLELTPEEVHQIGLREVTRINKEMQEIIRSVEFQGDFAAFLKFLRTDSRFYPRTGEDLLKEASFIAKKMDGKLPSLFKTLPRLPYGVEPVPDSIAPKYTAGRYVAPAQGSKEPGIYWVNTYALNSRSLYTLESLTLHEAVPGHHLQTAIARELQDLPQLRRSTYISAFGEGWGLYSEWLGLEAGFYQDPYSNFGRLTYEMWRACRLVVDTGMHSMGWSREKAMEYMASNTALSLHEVKTETDRYISWPGQALAYKIGELKIQELRKKAEAVLGTKFDVREFHDAVLRNGSVTLPILEQEVNAYIEKAAQ
jgi:uncharacterized protein (DUF885 family)